MLRLVLLVSLVGAVISFPYRIYNSGRDDLPLSYKYMGQPMGRVQALRQQPDGSAWVSDRMVGQQFFKHEGPAGHFHGHRHGSDGQVEWADGQRHQEFTHDHGPDGHGLGSDGHFHHGADGHTHGGSGIVPGADGHTHRGESGDRHSHHGAGGHSHGSGGYDHTHGSNKNRWEAKEEGEELPYKLIVDYGEYELREYPATNFACVKADVDNAVDPFAGMKEEDIDIFDVMSSKRYKSRPSSTMFWALFKYISGVNKDRQEIKMTRPVSSRHEVIEDREIGGDLETVEMCFYIESKHQNNVPEPEDNSPVYIKQRPKMRAYVRTFGGNTFSSDTWTIHRIILDGMLYGKAHEKDAYYTNGFTSPWAKNKRNEVWIKDTELYEPEPEQQQVEREQQEEEEEVDPVPEEEAPVDPVPEEVAPVDPVPEEEAPVDPIPEPVVPVDPKPVEAVPLPADVSQ